MVEVKEIPISDIVIPEERARATFTPEQYEELKASIQTHGFTIPILVRPLPDGKYELIDGEHRIQVAKELGYEKVPAVITDADDKKATLLNVLANTARGTQNPMDVAEALRKAYDAGATIEELAAATGHTKSWVRLYLTLTELPEHYKEALRTGKLKVGHIQEAMKLNDPVEIDAALQSALIHGWTVSVMKYYVEQRLNAIRRAEAEGDLKVLEHPPSPEEAQEMVQYGECMFCHRMVPRNDLRMPVMCEEDYELLMWINEQIGPPDKAKWIIYNAVNMYLQFQREQEEKMKQQRTTYVEQNQQPTYVYQQSQTYNQPSQTQQVIQPATQQNPNENLSEEDLKLIKLIKVLKSAGVI